MPETILVVEDDPHVLLSYEAVLKTRSQHGQHQPEQRLVGWWTFSRREYSAPQAVSIGLVSKAGRPRCAEAAPSERGVSPAHLTDDPRAGLEH